MSYTDFMDSAWLESLPACGGLCCRNPAHKECFARSQVAAISSIHIFSCISMRFRELHRFQGFWRVRKFAILWWLVLPRSRTDFFCSIPGGRDFMDFDTFSLISVIFYELHGFQGLWLTRKFVAG